VRLRTDFVTNSSNTSFIIRYTTPIEVARDMLKIFFAEWKEDWRETHPSKRRMNQFLKRNKTFGGNIIIPWTTNYTTYIYRDWFHVRVDTCNNTDWSHRGLRISQFVDTEKEGYALREKSFFLDLGDFKTKTGRQRDHEEMGRLFREMGISDETKKLFYNK